MKKKLFLFMILSLIAIFSPAQKTDIESEQGWNPPRTVVPEISEGESYENPEESKFETSGTNSLGSVIEAKWERFTGGQDVFTKESLFKEMTNPSIKGEAAAALVSLHLIMRLSKQDSLSKADAIKMASTNKIEESYHKMVVKLRNLKRELFVSGRPDFKKMQQGSATDCYFFSGTGWIAKNRPEVIVRSIKKLAGEKFEVRFPDGQSTVISAPTDAEIAYNDSPSTLSDGIWTSVLVKAEGAVEARTNEKRAAIEDPTARVDIGGGPAEIVKRWTGRSVENFNIGPKTRIKLVREAFARMERDRLMGEALTPKRPNKGLPGNHCYAILGFNPSTEILTIWNPWGNDFTPNGPSNFSNGYERKNGIFQMPLEDFLKHFRFLSIEKR